MRIADTRRFTVDNDERVAVAISEFVSPVAISEITSFSRLVKGGAGSVRA